MALWLALVFACAVSDVSSASYQNGTLYSLVILDQNIALQDVSSTQIVRFTSDCAVHCLGHTSCLSFGLQPIDANWARCYLSPKANPLIRTEGGSAIFSANPPDPADLSSVSCTDPPLDNSSLYTCNSSPTFEAAAMLRMGSSRAIVFTATNTYIACSTMTNIVEQGAEYCNSQRNVVGDPYIDPNGDRFISGPPDGAVGYIHSDMVYCRYYLFKDDLVYCYQHTDYTPWMMPCSTWTSMTIQERFGAGIPSSIDDVFGNFDFNYDFYFIRGNQIYLSTGNATVGTLAPGYPKHIHDVVPNMICDITGVQLGLNRGEYYYTKGKNVYKEVNGVVYYKKYLCN